MRLLVTAGGTGGHLYPALAVAEEVRRRVKCTILFVGTKHGLEARVVPAYGYSLSFVWMSGFHRRRLLRNLLFPLKMVISLLKAMLIVHRFQPDVIYGTGGYVSWPVVFSGIIMGRRTIIQEQNWMPGIVTRILAPYVNSVHLSFELSREFFKHKLNLHVSGNPTRKDLVDRSTEESYKLFQLDPAKITLFVFGGSQGSMSINQAVIRLLSRLSQHKHLQILWATGPRWYEGIQREIKILGNRARIYPYIEDMGAAYSVSDLLICRSGATTVAEITRVGVPAIFVPFPGAAGGHQVQNATMLVEVGAADMVMDEHLENNVLEEKVFSLIEDTAQRRGIARNARKLGKPHATERIADDILYMGLDCFTV